MTSCCHPHQMPWSGATGAIARCKRVSTGCGRKRRSVRVLRWICGVKLKPKAVNKPLPYFILHELDKPGSSTTVSQNIQVAQGCFRDTYVQVKSIGKPNNPEKGSAYGIQFRQRYLQNTQYF